MQYGAAGNSQFTAYLYRKPSNARKAPACHLTLWWEFRNRGVRNRAAPDRHQNEMRIHFLRKEQSSILLVSDWLKHTNTTLFPILKSSYESPIDKSGFTEKCTDLNAEGKSEWKCAKCQIQHWNFIVIQFNCHIFNLTLRGRQKPDKGWDFQHSLT